MTSVVKLIIDGKNVDLNEFVSSILSGTIEGAVCSLSGIGKDWKELELKITK